VIDLFALEAIENKFIIYYMKKKKIIVLFCMLKKNSHNFEFEVFFIVYYESGL
jgi:hypothetical protein